MDHNDHIVGTTYQWNLASYRERIIPRGTLCIELVEPKITKIKIGNGNKHYRDLPYIGGDVDLSNYYTKEETDNIINNLEFMSIADTKVYDSKDNLPLNNNDLGDVRFVKSTDEDIKPDPDEYIWNGNRWLLIGAPITDIDLSEYVKKSELEPRLKQIESELHVHDNKSILDATEEPFTHEDKEKLNLLPYEPFIGATEQSVGEDGLVPHPDTGDVDKYLKGDGTWSEIKTEYEPGDGISIEPPEDDHHQGVIHNDGVLNITQDDPDHMNILTVHTRDGTTDIEIPSDPIDDIYTQLVDPNQFVLLHDKPADWDTNWNKYFSLSHDLLEEEPLHFNPIKHWKRVNDTYVAGEPGDTFNEYEWYDKHYVGLPLEQCPEFETDLYYSGDLQLLIDGESLATSFGKLNDTIQHVQHIKHSMVSKNELSDVAFSGDYDDLIDVPVINGQTVAGVHPSLYYHIAATYFDTTAGWNDQPDLISEEKALYFYTDYHVAEGIPGVKLGDGVTPLKDLPVFNPTCKVTDEDIDNWNDKVGAVMSEIDTERLILYRNKGDVQ